jgi:hypothetical protein
MLVEMDVIKMDVMDKVLFQDMLSGLCKTVLVSLCACMGGADP